MLYGKLKKNQLSEEYFFRMNVCVCMLVCVRLHACSYGVCACICALVFMLCVRSRYGFVCAHLQGARMVFVCARINVSLSF